MRMKTAIAVPVKNERAGLDTLIKRLIPQMAPQDELIFVDAGSTDGTQELIREYSRTYENIRLFISKGASCGEGRNVAIRNTDADIIVHIDGGNLPRETWLSRLCAPLKADQADYVTGNISFMPIQRKILGVDIDLGEIYGLSLFRDLDRRDAGMAAGSSVAYRKWIWDKVGGLPGWCREGGEDVLFVKKIRKLCPEIRSAFVEDAIVLWQIGPALTDVLKRKLRFQVHLFLLYESLPELIKGSLVPSFLILAAFSAVFSPTLRIPAVLVFILEWIREGIKVSRIFLREKKRADLPFLNTLVSICLLLSLEGLNLFARTAGVIIGLSRIRKNLEFRRAAKKYLQTPAIP